MLRTTGTLSATGQTGRSARKNVQAAMAQNGRAQRIITGMLSTSEAEHGLNMDRVGQVLHNARTAGEIGLARISNDIAQAAVVHDIGLDTADVERIQANMNYRMGARTNAVDLLQSDLDISTGQRRNILDLEEAQFRGNVADYRAGMTIRQSRQNSNASIAQLRDSRLSANRQHQADLRRVGQDFWAAQMAADARVAARPVMPVLPPNVIETPLPEVMAPQSPPTEGEYAATRPVMGTSGSSGMFGTALGFAGSLITAMASSSDDRLKRSYNRVGTSPSGVPVYTFNYIKDGDHGPTYMGTSAQDLIAMGRSDAVLQKEKDGFYYVDYSKLDVEFEKIT